MNRPLTDRERCLALEVRVAELEEELAAYRANEDQEAKWAARVSEVEQMRRWLDMRWSTGTARMLIDLIEHAGVVRSKWALAEALHPTGIDRDYESGSVNVYVCLLRKRLVELVGSRCVETAWGHGYFVSTASAALLRSALEAHHD